METKDWVLLLVPIFCNGLIIFILQKIFERRQITRNIKFEYASFLRQKIDLSLEIHAKATRLLNEGNNENEKVILEILQQYIDSISDVYYYYVQNKIIFKSFDNHMERMAALVLKLKKYWLPKKINLVKISLILNKIRDELIVLKKDCIKLHF